MGLLSVLRLAAVIVGLVASPAARAAGPIPISANGAVLCGYLTSPPRPTAGVVLIHGSGPDGGRDYTAQAQLFAAHGIAALTYDKRGWSCSGGDWRHRPVELLAADAVAAARQLRRLKGVPVGYWGISQGGWVLARVGAIDPSAAFLIGVAATGISPEQQERWHKQRLALAAGYPAWARRTANRYWSAALDLMVLLDRHPGVAPALLENERAGSSFRLDYDPAADWRVSKAPLLLLYGSEDLLEPWFDSKDRIPRLRSPAANTQVEVFARASHAITRRTTGLAFDWGEAFDARYAPRMAAFIAQAENARAAPNLPSIDLAAWPVARRYSALVALPTLICLPLLLIAGALFQRSRRMAALALVGAIAYIALLILLIGVIHPQGSFYSSSARMPLWGWTFPITASLAVLLGTIATIRSVFSNSTIARGAMGSALVLFFAYWL